MEKHIEILVDRTEYITKEEAYKAINEQYHETGLDGYQDGIELMNRIAKIPAADVVEVHHGQWINERQEGLHSFSAECSLCGKRTLSYFSYYYCPNCGVMMDGEKNECTD